MTISASPILIRECESLDELGACVRLQTEVWGYAAEETMPRRAFVVAQNIGGQVIGAFDMSEVGADVRGDASSLVGFAMALPALKQDHPYLHSHMLGVHSSYRNQGIGRRLKLFQREEALARGITRMEWTFDPIEIKNAFLNIAKLGVVVRRYTPNLYGVSSSSLQGSLPTDRLHAEWWMGSTRVQDAVAGKPISLGPVEGSILVPRAIGQWKQSSDERERALLVQGEIRRKFQQAFANGLAVIGFLIDADGNGVFQLGVWEQPL